MDEGQGADAGEPGDLGEASEESSDMEDTPTETLAANEERRRVRMGFRRTRSVHEDVVRGRPYPTTDPARVMLFSDRVERIIQEIE